MLKREADRGWRVEARGRRVGGAGTKGGWAAGCEWVAGAGVPCAECGRHAQPTPAAQLSPCLTLALPKTWGCGARRRAHNLTNSKNVLTQSRVRVQAPQILRQTFGAVYPCSNSRGLAVYRRQGAAGAGAAPLGQAPQPSLCCTGTRCGPLTDPHFFPVQASAVIHLPLLPQKPQQKLWLRDFITQNVNYTELFILHILVNERWVAAGGMGATWWAGGQRWQEESAIVRCSSLCGLMWLLLPLVLHFLQKILPSRRKKCVPWVLCVVTTNSYVNPLKLGPNRLPMDELRLCFAVPPPQGEWVSSLTSRSDAP